MLGEQIGEEKGKVTARRVLSIDGGTKLEVSFQSSGKLLGVEHQTTVTYTAAVRPDGTVRTSRFLRRPSHRGVRIEHCGNSSEREDRHRIDALQWDGLRSEPLWWMEPRTVQRRESVSCISVRIDCGEAGACVEIARAKERHAQATK